MKKLFFLILVLSVSFVNAQAYSGKGDSKFQVGANLQSGGTGINASYDLGIGENISLGLSSSYLLGVKSDEFDVDFDNRIDFRARFNANLGNVININEAFDVYPGLSVGLKNFGGHLGTRYFFSDGFGLYSEFNLPFAMYKTGDLTYAETLHNQFTVNLGIVFNI